jgi:2-oxoglutarate dehydrogenase E1 component
MNQGSWKYISPRIIAALKHYGLSKKANVEYIGRGPCAASATGHHDQHEKELESFLTEAFL